MSLGEVRRGFDRIERRLDELVTKDRYEADRAAYETRVKALEESNTWRSRAVGAALLAAATSPLLTLLFQARGK